MENGDERLSGSDLGEKRNVDNQNFEAKVEDGLELGSRETADLEEVFAQASDSQEQLREPGEKTESGAGVMTVGDSGSMTINENSSTETSVEAIGVPVALGSPEELITVVSEEKEEDLVGVESSDKIDKGGTSSEVGSDGPSGRKDVSGNGETEVSKAGNREARNWETSGGKILPEDGKIEELKDNLDAEYQKNRGLADVSIELQQVEDEGPGEIPAVMDKEDWDGAGEELTGDVAVLNSDTIPTPPTPFNATKPCSQLCVRLTPAASALAARESDLLSAISLNLAEKLQKLLMLSSHRRLLLSKLVHLAPDLGLPPNFRSRLCNDHPDKFKTVDTSYGRALELVSWNPQLAVPMSFPEAAHGLIVDRPLKFKQLRLRRGLNVKRRHRDFLIRFQELPDVCPYSSSLEEIEKESIESEKRACALVREVLGLMVEKRTLIDHLTHFRKEFGLPNKLRGMVVRHPELFYVSLKGLRHSVFLVEGYDDKGRLLRRDETLAIKDQLMELVRESKRMRRERRKSHMQGVNVVDSAGVVHNELDDTDHEYDDGFEDIFESEDSSFDYVFDTDNNECYGVGAFGDSIEFWNSNASINRDNEEGRSRDPW